MRKTTYPQKPGKVLTVAFKMAMSATLALAGSRATGKAHPLYYGQGNRIKGMARIWQEAKEEYMKTVEKRTPDALKILRVEKDIRRSFSRILLKTSVKYGNNETRRKKRREENQRYLNQMWDYAGSRIRDIMKERYKFPRAGIITLGNGDFAIGYPGSTKIPIYPLRHNHLPELDFGDMIRSHLMELVRQCLKYGVPPKLARRFVDELVDRLLPFMDYVYTDRKTGRKNFIRGGIQELREVVDRIRVQFGTRNGRRQSITSAIAESQKEEPSKDKGDVAAQPEEIDVTDGWTSSDESAYAYDTSAEDTESIAQDHVKGFFERLITRAQEDAIIDWGDSIERLKKLIQEEILTDEDAEEIIRSAIEESRRIGVAFHGFASHIFPSPFKLSAAVYHGDEMAYDSSGFLLTSELFVAGGKGRADLVLFRRKFLTRADGSPPRVVYEPCMVVDLKTKSAFDIDIYGVESRSKQKQNIVSEFVLDRRRMTDDEWRNVVASDPSDSEVAQLQAYSEAILSEYHRSMWKDSSAPTDLLKAVIVIDSKENWGKIGEALLSLILETYWRGLDNKLSENEALRPRDNGQPLRMVLKVLSNTISSLETQPIQWVKEFNPFRHRIDDGREFILYLSVAGRGTPSQSAAAIAARWHGLQYVYSIAWHKHRDVLWLDLAGEYRDSALAQQRFRLTQQSASVKRFYKRRVQMTDLSSAVKEYLYEGGTLKNLRATVRPLLKNRRRPVVVVTGWGFLRRRTPDSLLGILNELVMTLISEIPTGSTVVWFAHPVPLAQNNTLYETRCIAPFYNNTHWEQYVDEIVWNLPSPPYRSGSRAPADDHIRVLVVEHCDVKTPRTELIHVDVLEGWGEDFRSGRRKQHADLYSRGAVAAPVRPARRYTQEDVTSAMTLISHLASDSVRPCPADAFEIETVQSEEKPAGDQGMPCRLRLRLYQYRDRIESDGRVKRLLPMDMINRKREYRTMGLDVRPPERSTRPPSEAFLSVRPVDDRSIAWSEIRALKHTIGLLERTQENSDDWKSLLKDLRAVVEIEDVSVVRSDELMNRLRLGRQTLETDNLSKKLWKRLWPIRSKIPRVLDSFQRHHIDRMIQRHPDLLLITGNHLFLLILAALNEEQAKAYTKTVESLWEYVTSWHMMGLGLRPDYPEIHTTGRSVMDRKKVLHRLRQRASQLNALLDKRVHPGEVRFGQLIIPKKTGSTGQRMLWLVFQRRPSGHEMNAALLTTRGVDPTLPPPGLLKSLVSETTYWSESDLSKLSQHAGLQKLGARVPVMVAQHRDLQALWILDEEQGWWTPVGRLHYTTHQFEDVTLVRTLALRKDSHIQSFLTEEVREIPSNIKHLVDIALFITSRGLEGCKSVKCQLSLDLDEKMYSVVFREQDSDVEPKRLLINRTADLLEILRRPDYECEPVVMDGERLIWNRFKDIEYSNDVKIIRPWVERSPFRQLALALPPTANDLVSVYRDVALELELYHDPWTCPLRYVTLKDIMEARTRTGYKDIDYMSPFGRPERLANESGMSHGSCWRFMIHTPHHIPPEVLELLEIRMTDTMAMSLARTRELVYWSEERSSWVTHSFDLLIKRRYHKEIRESWHLCQLLPGHKKMTFPGGYRMIENNWDPYFTIESDRVTIGLSRRYGDERSLVLHETCLAPRSPDDVREFLNEGMEKLLREYDMTPDRKLTAAIQGKIKDSLEGAGVSEERAALTFERVTVSRASFGGEQLHVVLSSTRGDEYEYPVLTWVHIIREWGRLNRDEVSEMVRSDLGELKLDESMLKHIINRCVQALRYRGIKVS